MIYDENGVAQCGIECVYKVGAIDFKKLIFCYFYFIWVECYGVIGMEVLNYDCWDICFVVCILGKKY